MKVVFLGASFQFEIASLLGGGCSRCLRLGCNDSNAGGAQKMCTTVLYFEWKMKSWTFQESVPNSTFPLHSDFNKICIIIERMEGKPWQESGHDKLQHGFATSAL